MAGVRGLIGLPCAQNQQCRVFNRIRTCETHAACKARELYTHTKTNGSGEGNTELQCVLTQCVCVSTLKPLCHVSGDDLLLFTVALFCRPGHLYYPVTILRFKLTRQSSLFLGEGEQLQGWRGLKELAADTGW